jgi:RsiW-degrading membrane proteinase PrsW (M82 family)
MPTFIAFILSFLFALIYSGILYWMDRHEKEPKKLILGAFFWGAIVATFVAMIANSIFGVGIFMLTEEEEIADFLTSIISAPLVEESVKGLAVLIIFLFVRSEFDNLTDGIVYAGIVALGFAATENVLYLSNEFSNSGWEGLFSLFYIRVILGGWNHAVYTAFTGIGLAVSRMSKNTGIKIIAPIIGFGIAIGAHFSHNFLASMIQDQNSVNRMLTVDWFGWVFMLVLLIVSSFNEKKWIRNQLNEEVQSGLLTLQQAAIACSPRKRNMAFLSAPSGSKKATRRFYTACVEMAFKKQQRARFGEESQHNSLIIDSYRTEIKNYRQNGIVK